MSLLLKALKQAEKGASETTAVPDLDLEPLTLATPKPRPQWVEPGESPSPGQPRLNWSLPRIGLVPAAALIAIVVALGYGVYVYRALHPASFSAVPPPAPAATPKAAPLARIEPLPAAPTATVPMPPQPAPAAASPSPKPKPHRQIEVSAPQPHETVIARQHPARIPLRKSTLITASPSPLDAAYAAWQAGHLAQAQSLYQRAAEENGGADAWLGLASIASLRGQTQQATTYYEKVLQLDPENAVAQAALLDNLGSNDNAAAEAHLQELIHQRPSAFLYYALGNFYAAQKRWADAESAYFEASRRAPENADFSYNLAVSLDHLQQYPAALHYYREALKLVGPDTRFDPRAAQSRIAQLAGQ